MVQQIATRDELTAQLTAAGEKLVIIDFYATWCGPCKKIAPDLQKFGQDNTDKLVVLKVDVDEAEALATEFGISAMPTFIFFKNSQQVEKFTGANFEKLKELALANF